MNSQIGVLAGFKTTLLENQYTRIGWEFVYWCDSQDGNGNKYTPGIDKIIVNKDTILYAIWTKDSSKIIFNGNDISITETKEYNISLDPKTKTATENLEKYNEIFKKEGYYIAGWNTEASGNGTSYEVNESINLTKEDVTLYAQWRECFTIAFEAGEDGSGTMTPMINIKPNKEVTLKANIFTNSITPYFIGWKEKTTNAIYSNGEIVTVNGSMTLVAQWEDKLMGDSLIDIVANNTFTDGQVYKLGINGKSETYTARIYNKGTTTISGTQSYGTQADVATASEYASNMVILKVNGDLTINSGATLTTVASTVNYGGPKGFFIYCTGTLTNNGTIDMIARGAKAEGQNIWLWKNISGDNPYEFIPKDGALGGERHGHGKNKGEDGIKRQTGGGGSGHGWNGYFGGAGTAGTSYSGGSSGSGGSSNTGYGNDGGINGGAGATGQAFSGGGAGNPGGKADLSRMYGSNGTGGTLIIYAASIYNNSKITSNGSAGGAPKNADSCTAGSSGAGSINIFYINNFVKGDITAEGGHSTASYAGGDGGKGSISCGNISSGTYVNSYRNY